jgi:hypothetical protein
MAISMGLVGVWFVGRRARQTPRLLQRAPEQVLDLGVEAAEVVVRPALDRVQEVAVHTQEEGLPLSHEAAYW